MAGHLRGGGLRPDPAARDAIARSAAAALVPENRQHAHPASVDSIPTSANQEDHVSMAAHGSRRLLPMAENLTGVIAIELLAAAQGCDFLAPLRSSPVLEAVRSTLRRAVPTLEDDRHFAPDIQAAIGLVRDGELAGVAGAVLPGCLD